MTADFDVAVVGSGFGGSLLAMIAKRLGRSVVLLERGRHPRFAIGESSTPLANLLLEELARRYDLPRLLPLAKWGAWQAVYPKIGCGLKRGFTFYHHRFDQPFAADPGRRDQLLVAASPHDGIADTHWYRPDFDEFLAREAQALGVEYLDEVGLNGVAFDGSTAGLEGTRNGRKVSIRAHFVVDATGPRGFLHRALKLPEDPFEHLPPTQALYAHFRGVRRWEEMHASDECRPYPVDDAAMHHVFDGGWIWVLRFNNGVTSAGVAATDDVANALRFDQGAAAWERLLARLPSVRAQFASAGTTRPFVHSARLSFRSRHVAGENWALLPSAAGFVDPLLSTGFPLTLLGLARLAKIIESKWTAPGFEEALDDYAAATRKELEIAERLAAALYANMRDFEIFAALALLYFAAASYTETARRLHRPELAGPTFLLGEHPTFGRELRECCDRALRWARTGWQERNEREILRRQILETVEPVDVAGLSRRDRRNWHPVDANDLFASAGKLGATHDEIAELLKRTGFKS